MRVTVICTVLDEAESIRRLLESLCTQTRPPDEVLIVDGGSHDGTVDAIQGYAGRLPVRLLVAPGSNISQGRNLAAGAASGDVIASTDAGVRLEPSWLERLVAPLAADLDCAVVAGFFVADPTTPFEVAMGATVLPALEEVDPATFLASSRSIAFRKTAWAAAGGYPEWLDYCEDLIFDLRLRSTAGEAAWAPGAIAHFRPRSSLGAFFKQYYRYARGDGKAGLWGKRHAIRYITYLLVLPGLLAVAARRPWLGLGLLLAGGAAYCARPYRRLRRCLPCLAPGERAQVLLLVPIIRVTGDLAKMLGYPMGLRWRLRNRRQPAIHWHEARKRNRDGTS